MTEVLVGAQALYDVDEAQLPHIRTDIPGPRSAELWARDARHHAGNSSLPAQTLKIVVRDAAGALVRDVDGNVFIDLCSGIVVTNAGHAPPAVVDAVSRQAGRLMHFFDFATEPRAEFFEALARTLPPSLDTFQMYTTGAEAVEAAMRLAKSYTGKYEFISFYQAWHGRTLAAMSLMGGFPLKHGYGPFPPGFLHSPNAYCYRCPLGLTRDSCEVACARFIERVYEQESERRLAAVIIEPVQGVGGAIEHPREFLEHMREFCDRTGALLIFDEILCGAGRTGTMWAFEHSGVIPDVLIAGKGLASGYPVSLLASRREILDKPPFGQPGAGASTFASGNLACAAGAATLGLFADGTILENTGRVGRSMLDALRSVQERHPIVGDVRGVGLLLAVELVRDRATKEPLPQPIARTLLRALARRGILAAGGSHVVRITPPLVISQRLALRAVELFEDALGDVEAELAA